MIEFNPQVRRSKYFFVARAQTTIDLHFFFWFFHLQRCSASPHMSSSLILLHGFSEHLPLFHRQTSLVSLLHSSLSMMHSQSKAASAFVVHSAATLAVIAMSTITNIRENQFSIGDGLSSKATAR